MELTGMRVYKPRGTRDVLPPEAAAWQLLEGTAHNLSRLYGYGEIRTPIFESADLFLRGVGETTDIVEKEMYTLARKGKRGETLTLRPEGTAPVARAFIENGLQSWQQPVKLYYLGPMFRYDRPQAGRYRQFHHFGAEVFGAQDAAIDAEIIDLAWTFFEKIGVRSLELHINSVGCPQCRTVMRAKLVEYFEPRIDNTCTNCKIRLKKNPLRLLDCKSRACREIAQDAPNLANYLCQECAEHFQDLRKYLGALGLPYQLNPRLVRGLDYYTKTAFEIINPTAGAQDAVGGGGRYDYLVEEIGGPPVSGTGFAIGLERAMLLLDSQEEKVTTQGIDVFVVSAGADRKEIFKILMELRAASISADQDYLNRSFKAQLKAANKLGARFVVIAGATEMAMNKVAVKDMLTGQQEEVARPQLKEYLQRII